MVGIKGMKGHSNLRRGNGKGWIQNGYIYVKFEGKNIRQHILTWIKFYGEIPEGCVIHHKDFDRQNNSIENLEMMTKKAHDKLHWNLRKGVKQ